MNEDASALENWVIFPCWLVVEPTHLKNMIVKLDHVPNSRGKNQKPLAN